MKKLMKTISILSILSMGILLISCGNKETTTQNVDLTISAAASLNEAMAELKTDFEKNNKNITLTCNFGSSGSLQKQIESGAPCDVFISAAESNMDDLDSKGEIEKGTNKVLLSNKLVLISPKNSDISSIEDLSTDKVQHIAMGEPSSVPAGKYAKESLENLNLFDKLQAKLIFGKDVKEVLSWVASENSEVGFVYKSDTIANDSVKIVEEVSDDYHTPINYKVGVVSSSKNINEAKIFEDYLFSSSAKKILEKYGYNTI